MSASVSTKFPISDDLTVRRARPDDAPALWRLAALDDAARPRGAHLVAEVREEIVAALPLDGGRAIADPFRRTADLVALLELRASQLAAGPPAIPGRAGVGREAALARTA
jgi:hypothetical protein